MSKNCICKKSITRLHKSSSFIYYGAVLKFSYYHYDLIYVIDLSNNCFSIYNRKSLLLIPYIRIMLKKTSESLLSYPHLYTPDFQFNDYDFYDLDVKSDLVSLSAIFFIDHFGHKAKFWLLEPNSLYNPNHDVIMTGNYLLESAGDFHA